MKRICRSAGWILRGLLLWVTAFCCAAALGASPEKLTPLPEGITLPVLLTRSLDARHVRVGEPVVAELAQRVPLADGGWLPQKAKVIGTVVACDNTSLTLRFDRLRLGEQEEPVDVTLLAAAHWFDVHQSKIPLAAPDRATSNPNDWTTRQIGGDEVYRSGGWGKVYDRYSEPVGHADPNGVYGPPIVVGGPARAMGPFSTTATGVYDLPGIEIGSGGGKGRPIVLRLTSRKWQLHSVTAFLLVTTGP
ncbi:MAG TPA: hypothetical protein VGG59_13790 [Acidobacteriaceae bacterium]|jgi:hypothetical protein